MIGNPGGGRTVDQARDSIPAAGGGLVGLRLSRFQILCSSSRQDRHVRRWGRDLFVDAALELLRPIRGAVGRVPGPTIWLNAVQLYIGRDAPFYLALLVRRPHEILLGRVPNRCAAAEEEAPKRTASARTKFIGSCLLEDRRRRLITNPSPVRRCFAGAWSRAR